MVSSLFLFDLDGTITIDEMLPLMAQELGIENDIASITEKTLAGEIDFATSFRLRFAVLQRLPLEKVQAIAHAMALQPDIIKFIQQHREQCFIITGNLDCWVAPLLKRIGCRAYTSMSGEDHGNIVVKHILDKGAITHQLRASGKRLIAVGDSYNDISMFRQADISIAYFGAHAPIPVVAENADHVCSSGVELYGLLMKV